jgi:GAF domain-containing protein
VSFIMERDINIIEQQTDELGRRSHILQAEADERTRAVLITADIGKLMTGVRDADEMLKQVANLIIMRFDLYHAQIFLVDSAAKKAVLKAASGVAGEDLLSKNHSIPLGAPSVVTRVITRGEAVAVNDTDTDPIHRRNELLPLTRSEVGLPLRVSGQVIGALNIQSVTPNDFKMADVAMFQTIADQMAVAVENARLFQRAQRDLEDIETLNRQLTGEAWRSYLSGRASNAAVGFASTGGTVTPIATEDDGGEKEKGTVSLPLKIRGETIGMLDVTPRSGEAPDEETQLMLQAVAERVALALDSTRLGEQSQRQAEREQILSKISADLQATTDMNAILRIVARESSRALGAPRSFIHLALDYDKER